MKQYLCECGKEFISSQSFNGHKSNCIEHLVAVGKIANKQEWLLKKQEQNKSSAEKRKANNMAQAKQKTQQWILEQHICESCGKIMTEKYGSGRFCCKSCANKFSSSKVKQHIVPNNLEKLKVTNHESYLSRLNEYNKNPNKCFICNKDLPYNKRLNKLCGCAECHAKYMSVVQQKAYDEGRRTGWIYHNEISYPEKYFMAVFDKHNIKYDFQVPLFNGHSTYHLDFVIKGNIDFEVDGLQHYREDYWIEHDKQRDEFVKSKGYKVYRFKWSNPKNEEEMQAKINELLDWIKLP